MPAVTLVDFLLARIAEDEAIARAAAEEAPAPWSVSAGGLLYPGPPAQEIPLIYDDSGGDHVNVHFARWDPARVIAECDAKRAVIDVALGHAASIDGEWGCCHPATSIRAELVLADEEYGEVDRVLTPDGCDGVQEAWAALGPLAVPYADHPDFDPAWADSSVPPTRPR